MLQTKKKFIPGIPSTEFIEHLSVQFYQAQQAVFQRKESRNESSFHRNESLFVPLKH